jgi:hypothetical protein
VAAATPATINHHALITLTFETLQQHNQEEYQHLVQRIRIRRAAVLGGVLSGKISQNVSKVSFLLNFAVCELPTALTSENVSQRAEAWYIFRAQALQAQIVLWYLGL